MTLSPYRVAVFCGGHAGGSPEYAQAADEVGRGLARAGFGIVFGGSNLGLMGKLAYAALEEGGQVIGVLPDSLMGRETPFPELRDLRRVPDFPTRKTMLLNLSRAVVALPGGYGTLDELFEAATLSGLGLSDQRLWLVNTRGYFDALLAFLDHAVREGFTPPTQRALIRTVPSPAALIDELVRERAASA